VLRSFPPPFLPVSIFYWLILIRYLHPVRKWIERNMRSSRGYYLFICILLTVLVLLAGCLALFPASDTTPVLTPTPSGPVAVTTRMEETLAPNSCRYVAIATGTHRSLALRDDGTVVAWGDTDNGMMKVPANLRNVTAIAAGHWHNLALTKNGTVVAWGNIYHGDWLVPPDLNGVVAIAAGTEHSLALKKGGSVVTWGSCGEGQCAVPKRLENYLAVAAGPWRSVVLKSDGTIQTFNLEEHYGTGQNLTGIVAISAGYAHVLALRKNGTVVAWGDNTYGQCDVPEGLDHVRAISAGYWHNLAIKDDGTVVAWGGKSIESLVKDYDQFSVPPNLTDITAISAGELHNLALKQDGTIVAWGSNESGESAPSLCRYEKVMLG
jgi:alpha-tubulin suppressor-like RCC1 family protein